MPKNVLNRMKSVFTVGKPPVSSDPPRAEKDVNWNDHFNYRETSPEKAGEKQMHRIGKRNRFGEAGLVLGGLSVLLTFMEYIGMGFFLVRSVQYDVSNVKISIVKDIASSIARLDLIPLGVFVIIAVSAAVLSTILGLVFGFLGSRKRNNRTVSVIGLICSCVSAAAFLTGIVIIFVFYVVHS